MLKICHEQGSQEWLDYRKSKVMATDCAVIMGTNPFKSEKDLWEEKLGITPPLVLNDAMKRGQLLEPEARDIFIKSTKIEMYPEVIESIEHPWMAASLDGISSCGKYILEIKCMGEKNHEEALCELIKPYYISQMQHQLLCTGADVCYFMSYRPENECSFVIHEIYPDYNLFPFIIEKERKFYEKMCTMDCPEPFILQLRN